MPYWQSKRTLVPSRGEVRFQVRGSSCAVPKAPFEGRQRVQLDCHYGIRAQEPYMVWFVECNSIEVQVRSGYGLYRKKDETY